jgi:hypothetical protein
MFSKTTQSLSLVALFASSIQPAAAAYDLIVSHAGSTFFDGWTFATGYDNTSEYLSLLSWDVLMLKLVVQRTVMSSGRVIPM